MRESSFSMSPLHAMNAMNGTHKSKGAGATGVAVPSASAAPKDVHVQVALRCRPLNPSEQHSGERTAVSCVPSAREVHINSLSGVGKTKSNAARKAYTFDHVFGATSTQAEVYEAVAAPIVEEVLQGYNCTVFAYGQTGTGKTHTMEGQKDFQEQTMKERRLSDNAGIIPRAINHVFRYLRQRHDEYTVRVSHLELYNEQLTDLLSINNEGDVNNGENLRIFDDASKGVFVHGLEEIPVRSEEEIFAVLDKSAQKRKTAETLMNKFSSRSHSVFTVTIHIRESTPEGEDLLKVGKLNLVDLAGSEDVRRSGAVSQRAREAGNINQSLLTLGRVITALVEKHPHVPYRDSKLTRLLQESLGGRNKTSIIATIGPGISSIDETASTLEYAHRAKSIKNRPQVNQMMTKRALIKEYMEEIAKLKRELDATRSKNGVFIPPEDYEKMVSSSKGQGERITELVDAAEKQDEELKAVRQSLDRVSEILSERERELEETQVELQNSRELVVKIEQELDVERSEKMQAEYVIECNEKSEAKLAEQANELMKVLGESVTQLDRMHEKMERMNANERKNLNRIDALRKNTISAVNGIQRKLEMNLKEYESKMNRIAQESQSVSERSIAQRSEMNGCMIQLHSQMDSTLNNMNHLCKTSVNQLNESFKSFSSEYINSVSTLDSASNEMYSELELICEQVEVYGMRMDEITTGMADSCERMMASIVENAERDREFRETVVAQMNSEWNSEKNALLNELKNANLENEVYKQKNARMNGELKQSLQNSFMQILNDFERDNLDSNERNSVNLNAHLDSCTDSIQRMDSLVDLTTQELESVDVNCTNALKSTQNVMRSEYGTNVRTVRGFISNSNALMNALNDHRNVFIREKNAVVSQLNETNEGMLSVVDGFGVRIESQIVSEGVLSVENSLNQFIERIGSDIDGITGLFDDFGENLNEIVRDGNVYLKNCVIENGVNVGLNGICDSVNNCAEEEVKLTSRLGTTPSKKEWKYPKKLERSEDRDALKRKFVMQSLNGNQMEVESELENAECFMNDKQLETVTSMKSSQDEDHYDERSDDKENEELVFSDEMQQQQQEQQLTSLRKPSIRKTTRSRTRTQSKLV